MPRNIDFYRLPRPVQERFAAATSSAAPPPPLLYHRAPRTKAWAFLVASAALAVIAAMEYRTGWGDVASPLALHGPKMLAIDALLFGAVTYGLLHAARIFTSLASLPFRAGMYLFPACAVDASRAVLRVWPLSEAESVERVGLPTPGISLRMRDGTRVLVPASNLADAARAEAALGPLRQELARAIAERDPRALAELDPLNERAMSSPVGPTEAMTHRMATFLRVDWAVALVLGILLAEALGSVRNAFSDDAMFRQAVASGGAPALRSYLSREGRHSDEVRGVLLPRSELREAESQGTVDAVEAFARANPSSKIGPEVDEAMRRALLFALDEAKKPGTLPALEQFARRYPQPYVRAEFSAARHGVFSKALASWRDSARPDAPTAAFVERLFAWSEQHGPREEIRFHQSPSQSMDAADRSVKRSGHYPGPDALPSIYTTPDALRPRERRVEDAIVKGFGDTFPSEVLSLQAGQPLASDAPAPLVPTLVIDYSPEWARANTACAKPDTVFAGLVFAFSATFFLPGEAPLRLNVKTSRAAETWKFKPDGLSREAFELKVYSAMVDGMFDQLEKKLVDVLL